MRKKILLILFLVITFLSSFGYSAQNSSEILKDIKNKNFERALQRCEDILNNPENDSALSAAIFHKFRILKTTGEYEEALNFLNNAQEQYGAKQIPAHFPETLPLTVPYEISISVPVWRAEIYRAQNDYTKALDELVGLKALIDKYVKVSQHKAARYLAFRKLCVQKQLAVYLENTGNYEAAVSQLLNATEYGESFCSLDRRPTDRLTFFPIYLTFVDLPEKIGDLYKETGETKKALYYYNLALENMKKLYVPDFLPERHIATKSQAIPRLTKKIKQVEEGAINLQPEGTQCSCARCDQNCGCGCR